MYVEATNIVPIVSPNATCSIMYKEVGLFIFAAATHECCSRSLSIPPCAPVMDSSLLLLAKQAAPRFPAARTMSAYLKIAAVGTLGTVRTDNKISFAFRINSPHWTPLQLRQEVLALPLAWTPASAFGTATAYK